MESLHKSPVGVVLFIVRKWSDRAVRHKHGPLEEIWHRLTWIKS